MINFSQVFIDFLVLMLLAYFVEHLTVEGLSRIASIIKRSDTNTDHYTYNRYIETYTNIRIDIKIHLQAGFYTSSNYQSK